MINKSIIGAICSCLTLFSFCADAALLSRLGGLAYYDTELDITWATDANINGQANWFDQQAWVSGLTISGVSGWRLPSVDVNGDDNIVNCSPGGVVGCIDNEMGYLYYEEGISSLAPGPFSNIVSGTLSNGASSSYWSSTLNFPGSNSAQIFEFENGGNGSGHTLLADYIYAWAVHDGDVSAVPVPPAIWLFGSGLIGLVGFYRRMKA